MTPAQKKALRRHRKKLRQAFADATAAATTPGNARTWLFPYLAAVLKIHQGLTANSGNGLSKVRAKDPRAAFFKLLKTSKRDSRTRSRWAAALAHAYRSDISPDRLPKWLKKGGGVAGRAAGLANAARTPQQTPNLPANSIMPTSALDASPEAHDLPSEANHLVAEPTSDSKMNEANLDQTPVSLDNQRGIRSKRI